MTRRMVSVGVLLPFFMGLFFLASPVAVQTVSAHVYPSRQAMTARQQPKVHPNAGPTTSCTVNNAGDLWVDPQTGEVWKCRCISEVTPQGPKVVCQWRLILARPSRSTWINLNSGYYMDVLSSSSLDGAQVDQWLYTDSNSQFWDMYNPFDAYLTATNDNSQKCLDVQGGSTSWGAQIIQWHCNGNPDQLWAWTWTGSYNVYGWPVWNIINTNSGLCLGISNGSVRAGAYAVQWPCNGSPDQAWW